MESIFNLDIFADTIMPGITLISGIILGVYRYKHLSWILFYLAINSFIFGYSNYLADQSINNLFIYNSFGLLENLIIGLLINQLISDHKFKIALFMALSTNIILFTLKFVSDINFTTKYSSIIMLSSAIGQLMCTIYFITKILQSEIITDLEMNTILIFGSFFIFHTGSLAIEFGYWQYSGQGKLNSGYIWLGYDLLLITKYLIILYAFIKFQKLLLPQTIKN